MTECEFKKLCDEVCDDTRECALSEYDEIKACDDHRTFERIFNSSQFKKQYEEKIRKATDDFREELVDAINALKRHGSLDMWVTHRQVAEVIRTHGLEE